METEEKERFRDSIGTVTSSGKRAWIYPKKPDGKWYTYRKWVSYALLSFLFLAPFIKIEGNQFLLFNVLERRFHIFGFPFWPQDFHLFVISMIIGVVFVTLFTVAFGRLFCGWVCPQTIFMEMVFRRIEYWIEGDRGKQIRLAKQDWNLEKIGKKGLKFIIFLMISFWIANVFLAYLIGSDTLLEYVTDGPSNHMRTLIPLAIFTGVFYFVFAWFREQVCVIACPYGRLQGVLLDEESVVVAYDHKRGERDKGRKKFKKNEDRESLGYGDCIDCFQCVHVCPTGIDIRNGTQMECVNCTACIDACNHIMRNVNLPEGLIRYASEAQISNKKPFRLTGRMKGYIGVLFILTGLLTGMLFLRNDVEATVLRLPGQLYQHKADDMISNVFTYKLINKTTKDISNVRLKLINSTGTLKRVATHDTLTIPKQGIAEGTFFVDIDNADLKADRNTIKIGVYEGDELIETTKANFVGPRRF